MKAGSKIVEAPKPPLDLAKVGRPAQTGRRWPGRVRKAGYWAVVLVLVAVNLNRLRDAWPPLEPAAITRLIERNKLDDAEGALRDRLRRAPYEGESRMNLARILLRRGDLAGASAQFRLVPPWWPSKPEALLTEGQTAMASGLAVQAEAAWRACLADDPLHPTPPRIFSAAAGELIRLLNLEGRQDESIAALWSISEGSSESDRPSVLRSILDLRLQAAKPPTDPASLTTLRRFADADPADGKARLALAKSARVSGRLDEALRWVDSALKARPDDLAAKAERLAILNDQGNRAEVQAEVARLPSTPEVDAIADLWVFRGLAREYADDPTGAAEAYRRALALRADDEALLERLAKVDDQRGDRDQARSDRLRAQTLREARLAIPEAYRADLDVLSNNERRPDADRISLTQSRLAELATTLGWTREAAAWKRPDGRPAKP